MKHKLHKLLVALLFLVPLFTINACNTGSPQLAEGGIGGSGIAVGRINALGSITVNGIEYDTSQAKLKRDGVTVNSQNDYAVGEVVTIKGSINTDAKTGTAASVVFVDLLEGPVTAKPPLLAGSLQVLGQTVNTDDLTILHGFQLISDLNPADIIEVSGYTNANGIIQATSITLKQSLIDTFEVKGTIRNLDQVNQTFTLNNLTVGFANADVSSIGNPLSEGLPVKISAQVLLNNFLVAKTITRQEAIALTPDADTEVEGIITRFASPADFDLNNVRVVTTTNTIFKDGIITDLALNVLVEVEGVVNNQGLLVANSVELVQTENLPKIEANIDAIDLQNRTLQIFGKTIHINSSTILFDESIQKVNPFQFGKLTVGDYVDIKLQVQSDGSLHALRLSREDQENDFGFKAIVKNVDQASGTFTLHGIQMISDATTEYFDIKEQPIDRATFYGAIQEGVSLVAAEGDPLGANTIIMHAIFVDLTPP